MSEDLLNLIDSARPEPVAERFAGELPLGLRSPAEILDIAAHTDPTPTYKLSYPQREALIEPWKMRGYRWIYIERAWGGGDQPRDERFTKYYSGDPYALHTAHARKPTLSVLEREGLIEPTARAQSRYADPRPRRAGWCLSEEAERFSAALCLKRWPARAIELFSARIRVNCLVMRAAGDPRASQLAGYELTLPEHTSELIRLSGSDWWTW